MNRSKDVGSEPDHPPYVVSGDIEYLVNLWGEDHGFVIPDEVFFLRLREQFNLFMKKIFPGYVFIEEGQLRKDLQNLVPNTCSTLSLDRIYYKADHYLDLTRSVDENMQDVGLCSRTSKSVEDQLDKIDGTSQVVLVDDVVFTGSVIAKVVEWLRERKIEIIGVYAGIAIEDGGSMIRKLGVPVYAAHAFSEVVDEVCERDFYPGVLMSGRTFHEKPSVGFPYMNPFGNTDWASIPEEWVESMSRFCISHSMKLFHEIERLSGRPVLYADIDRKVYAFGEVRPEDRFIDLLLDSL